MRKYSWLISAGAFALAMPAFAQDQAETTPSPTEAASVEDETQDGGDIIVTATRRAEALADVPLAVTAIGGESLQNSGATDIRQLNQLAPSLLVSSTGSEANGSARIRGIGTVGDNPGLESSVAVFIDGVYRSRSGIGLNELGEVERIEVLRGPQGTLFGRNASAGLIHVITKRPSFEFGGYGEVTYGSYDLMRVAGAVTGPVTDHLALRVDGVLVRRDGFMEIINATNGTEGRANDRDRHFIRAQALYEPTDALSFRLITDYSKREESCCAAAYRSTAETFDPTPGVPGDYAVRATNRVVQIMTSMGAVFPTPGDRYSRQIAITPGRSYRGETEEWGVSGELNYNLGTSALTSITAFRDYDSAQGGDIDYSSLDLLYRTYDGGANQGLRRQFRTFTQELRLQGSAFEDRLDWLVGGYYANEKLKLTDNLQFGNDYGQFLACRLMSAVARPVAFGGPPAGTDDPALRNTAAPGCLSTSGVPVFGSGRGFLAGAFATPNAAGGTDGSQLLAAFDRLSTVKNVGFNTGNFTQRSRNYAFFTHNIFHVLDKVDLTLGLRYTNENKRISGDFNNTNTICPTQRAQAGPAIAGTANPTTKALLGGAILFSCLFNSSSSLNALALNDEKGEDEFTGTAVLSWKPSSDLMLYGSYSKGYKAGGYNLDASALGSPTGGLTPANVANLRFEPEKVDAFELGFKYDGRRFNLNVAAFRQDFRSFQLNTFNGLFFLVQNINGCSALVGGSGADEDTSGTTGTCAADNVTAGVRSQGVEMEASAYPTDDLAVTAGFTYATTKYREDLVGNIAGTVPVATELFLLPGDLLSNAPELVVTGSFAWTPQLGTSGLTGLLYADTRLSSDYNTGSDLFPEKEQDSFATVNARVGVRGPDQRWSLELWAQNLFNEDYDQVAFNSPLQASGQGSRAHVQSFGGYAAQLFSAYLGEPRTYGITGRFRF